MRRIMPVPKAMRELLGVATVASVVLAVMVLAALVVSPIAGWGWIPASVLAQFPGVPGPEVDPVVPLASLKGVPVPEPPNLEEFIKDRPASVRLGKALFWDMQVGSDGVQACASCHFSAGADNRSRNQLSPGLLGGDTTFDTGGPNFKLESDDFPFHRFADPTDRFSAILSDSNDVVSSMGVVLTKFLDIVPGSAEDLGSGQRDLVFNVDGVNVRRVEPRNTPTMINAVFNFDNFWDGRARNVFNGVNPFGDIDPDAFLLKRSADATQLESVRVALENSSLASQAVGPPLSGFEMSFEGRTFPKLGKKMLSLTPLGKQLVHPEDSVLGADALPDKGLSSTYKAMIEAAFQPEWWDSDLIITEGVDGTLIFTSPPATPLTTSEFTLMEHNFSLFFGLAVQMYESTLIADETPFDRFLEGQRDALTEQQEKGLGIFEGKGRCINCHQAAEMTNASVAHVSNEILERMNMAEGCAIYDNGFYNIGVRPTGDDLGRGGIDPFGNPLSHTRRAQMGLFVDTSPEGVPVLDPDDECDSRAAVDGAIKVPGLRNVELTAPYFHNGGQLTLRQVVEFYNRGGDFHEQNIDNLDPDIQELSLSERDIDEVVAFLRALTDERVRFQQAPFDHPQLFVPNGHTFVTNDDGTVTDTQELLEVPAVGADGGAPLLSFLEEPVALSCGVPSDGQPGALVLSWKAHANPDVVGYNVYRTRVSGGPYEKVRFLPATGTSFRDQGLVSGVTFHYVVTAVDSFGNESPGSAELSGTTL